MSNDEYTTTKEDLEGGGGGGAKPRGKYTGTISRAKSKSDKNGKAYLGFGVSVTRGKLKKALFFENYLPLSNKASKFQVARRNSLLKAIGLAEGEIPPGAPGGPQPGVLDGTSIDFTVEHTYENVPGEEFDVTTSDWNKSKWATEDWASCLDDKGRLVKTPDGQVPKGEDGEPEPIEPRETITFYAISDDFDGIGGDGDSSPSDSEDEPAAGGWG